MFFSLNFIFFAYFLSKFDFVYQNCKIVSAEQFYAKIIVFHARLTKLLPDKYMVKKSPKTPLDDVEICHNLYIFGKFVKNGAFFVFTVNSESLSLSR